MSRCSKLFFLCLAALRLVANNFLSSQAEAVALKPSIARPARPTKSGKVVIQLDINGSDPPKTRGGYFKTHSLKPNKKEDLKGGVEATLQMRKSGLVLLQRKRRRSRGKVTDYMSYNDNDSDSSYISKETDYPSSETSEYPNDNDPVVKACDPQVYNCKNTAELEKKKRI